MRHLKKEIGISIYNINEKILVEYYGQNILILIIH